MKKHVIIATGAALLSTSAFATKARMTALGQDGDRGSQYIQDGRNSFRNAAHVNNMNNYIVTEWGNAGGAAEGGLFRTTGSFAYGLYFNNSVNQAEAFDADRSKVPGAGEFLAPDNALDFFFGGDAGVQWGARLHYANSTDEATERENSAFGLGLGVIAGDLAAYLNLGLSDESTGTGGAAGKDNKFEGKTSINVGATYNWNNWTFHADYNAGGAELTAPGATAHDYDVTTIQVGAAQTHEISSTAMVFTALTFTSESTERNYTAVGTVGAGNDVETSNTALGATVGFETDATSWLTWRGSIRQNVFINSGDQEGQGVNATIRGKSVTNANTTVVAAGASLTFGKLIIDGTIAGASGNGNLNLDTVLGNVAVSYWF